MDAVQVADIEGALISVGLFATAVVVASAVSPASRRALADVLAGTATWLAAAIALGATLGSLWFSEAAGFPPCDLCWYQRYAMYPLPIVLGLAAVLDRAVLRLGGVALAGAGLAVSAYHNVVETFGVGGGSCDPTNPCTIRWVEGLGFFTIPRMAAACFLMIIVLTLYDHLALRHLEDSP